MQIGQATESIKDDCQVWQQLIERWAPEALE